jgi:hypothetical protein
VGERIVGAVLAVREHRERGVRHRVVGIDGERLLEERTRVVPVRELAFGGDLPGREHGNRRGGHERRARGMRASAVAADHAAATNSPAKAKYT